MEKELLKQKLQSFLDFEARSGSMEPALITSEYVYRMWGGKVSLEEIEEVMKEMRFTRGTSSEETK